MGKFGKNQDHCFTIKTVKIKNMTGKAVRTASAVFLVFFLSTCGIEENPYLEAVPIGNIFPNLANSVEVFLPNYSSVQYFTNFVIYYRIYTSSYLELSTITEGYNFSFINNDLQNHFNGIKPYTATDSVSGVSLDSIFSRYRYYTLELQNALIDIVLNGGSRLTIEFPEPGLSTLTRVNISPPSVVTGVMLRSGKFTHQPDRFFNNASDLIANANQNINADVSGGANVHRYVSMYIAAAGRDQQNLSIIYSKPTWLGLFRLKDR
jgi:hypothetical protein